jgi:hypothetical protein
MPYLDACLRLRLAGAQEASSSWAIPGRWPPRRGTRSPDHPSDGRWRRASAATRSRPTGAPIRPRRTPPHDAPSGRTCRLPYRVPPRPQTGATPGGAREHRADASPRFFLVGVERAPRVRDDGLLGAQGVDEQARAGVPKSIAAVRLQIPRRHEVSWGCPGVSLNPRRARRRARVQSSPGPQRNASPPTRQLSRALLGAGVRPRRGAPRTAAGRSPGDRSTPLGQADDVMRDHAIGAAADSAAPARLGQHRSTEALPRSRCRAPASGSRATALARGARSRSWRPTHRTSGTVALASPAGSHAGPTVPRTVPHGP